MTAVDNLRAQGKKVGLVRPRLWRPFPTQEMLAAFGNVPVVGVCDRAMAFGMEHHPMAQEIRTMFYDAPNRPKICEFMIGLGGRDVTIGDMEKILTRLLDVKNGAPVGPVEYVGVRQ
jgi:pyruvate ferredoxin oxidoreductase alpha subunit